jgi:C-methyltransferase C-terminal domain/Putative zinc binding domain/Methyltransferase domain
VSAPEPLIPTSLRTRTTCRICGSPHLAPLLDLGEQCIAGAFADPGGNDPVERAIPLELVRCDMTADQDACGLIQTRHTVPGSILYRSYWYRSGVNRTMTENLHGIAQEAESLVGLEAGDLVVDIGCNDGTLLDGYQAQQLKYLGFDPSDVARYAIEKGYEVIGDFFSGQRLAERYPDQKAKVITSIAMFYDLEDPGAFVRDVAAGLAEDGVWAMELHYLPLMLERNAFDAIVHEHLEYYSLAVLERLFAAAGLEAIAASVNDVNGGSIRLLIGHRGRRESLPEHKQALQDLRLREFEMALDSPKPYERFAKGAETVRGDLSKLCRSLGEEGKTIHVYGASTKGNTILQYAGLDHSVIPYAADRNSDKWGSRTIKTEIPIVSEEDSRAMNPDYYLVLPWHFLDEFLERETAFFDRGGRFIVPLPEVRIMGPESTE